MASAKKTGVDYTTPEIRSASKREVTAIKKYAADRGEPFEKRPLETDAAGNYSVKLKSGSWQGEPPFLPPTVGARKKKG